MTHYADWTFERPELAMAMAAETYDRLLALARSPTQSPFGSATKWSSIERTVKAFVEFKPVWFFREYGAILAVGDYGPKIRKLSGTFRLTDEELRRANKKLFHPASFVAPYTPCGTCGF